MGEIGEAFSIAFHLLISGDAQLFAIVLLSLKVSLTAVMTGCLLGFGAGAVLAAFDFPGRRPIVVLLNAFMGLPPVVVGLIVYLLLSRSGPLGVLGLLYTPTAMIIAQILLVTPLIAALSYSILRNLHREYDEFFRSIGLSRPQTIKALLHDGRSGLATVALAGFGRAISEVGAVMIVGGNINHVTRIMTTAIALETSKGALAMALALGMILICISVTINAAVALLRPAAHEDSYA
jgi:tungstate transport system permease protein